LRFGERAVFFGGFAGRRAPAFAGFDAGLAFFAAAGFGARLLAPSCCSGRP
jgi:hypothetical protein